MNITALTSITLLSVVLLQGCGGGGGSDPVAEDPVAEDPVVEDPVIEDPVVEDPVTVTPLDTELRALIATNNFTGNPATNRNLPDISSPLAQLGKKLFFAKNLGGIQDAACVSCHHPVLGGGDSLSLPVGVNSVDANGNSAHNLLGHGRFNTTAGALPSVPRNSPTTFNIGLWDNGLFWDSRIESTGGEANGNGTQSPIITPDSSDSSSADSFLVASTSLPAAQARFPVTSADEMRADFASANTNQELRSLLANRLEAIALWQGEFDNAYGDNAVSFDRIGEALGEYERSMVFINNPWKTYVDGDNSALSDQQKEGAILFLTDVEDNGAGCIRCHSGDTFTDELHHIVGFPQIGVGKGNDSGNGDDADFGRENISGNDADRFHFRTPSLLNVAVTAPYGHAGAYENLNQVMNHYNNPNGAVDDYFGAVNNTAFATDADFCNVPQFADIITASGNSCESLYPNAFANSQDVLRRLNDNNVTSTVLPVPNLNPGERQDLIAFLDALTDPCVTDRDCLNPWIVDGDDVADFPDTLPLLATDRDAVEL